MMYSQLSNDLWNDGCCEFLSNLSVNAKLSTKSRNYWFVVHPIFVGSGGLASAQRPSCLHKNCPLSERQEPGRVDVKVKE